MTATVLKTKEINKLFYITLEQICTYPTYNTDYAITFHYFIDNVYKKRKQKKVNDIATASKIFSNYCKEAERDARKKAIEETAQRLKSFDIFGAPSLEETKEAIKNDQTSIINYLLDYIEEIEA